MPDMPTWTFGEGVHALTLTRMKAHDQDESTLTRMKAHDHRCFRRELAHVRSKELCQPPSHPQRAVPAHTHIKKAVPVPNSLSESCASPTLT
jgi:hypothetical protein